MNLLLLFETDRVEGERYRVGGHRAHHLLDVLGVGPGARIHVGRLDGPVGEAEVQGIGDRAVDLVATGWRAAPTLPALRLLLAVPRPKILRRLLPQIAALGVEELVLFRCWRVDRSHLDTEMLDPAVQRPLLDEGLMQACLTRRPRVRLELRFRPWVEDRLADEVPGELRFVAHPRAEARLPSDLGDDPPRALVVGPERGLLDEEVELFVRTGARPAHLGPGILKVETACVAGLAGLGRA